MLTATSAFADVSVVASVDRNQIAFGESVTLTIAVQGTQSGAQPAIPRVDGLRFDGPSTQSSFSLDNGRMSQSISFVYQVTPARTGEFTIPAIQVSVGDKAYSTEPIQLAVGKGAAPADSSERLFAQIRIPSKQVYLGQTEPVQVVLFARADVPLRGLSSFNYDADGLEFKFQQNPKTGTQIVNGQSFNLVAIEGSISPSRTGTLNLGPCILKVQLTGKRQGGNGWFNDPMFDQMFGRTEVKEVPVTVDAVPIEVLPLPEKGRPADFSGAVGQWNLEVTAKPTDVAVGDPITLTIKVSGNGNIDTVPAPKLGPLDGFKTYDPTTKTTKDELNTTGERVIQQVLMARSTDVKELPGLQLVYFDPINQEYRKAIQPPIKLVVTAGGGGHTTIVSGGGPLHIDEKLGQDIVYLKGDMGPVPESGSFCETTTFWALNAAPVLALLGTVGWKRRTDRLRGDVAYARRTRAAKKARKRLASASSYDEIQHALQQYLGDRLNIPVGGITAAVVDEQLVPRGVNGELVARAKACFEACDTARFAGGSADTSVQATRENVERLIDELETKQL
ncbi:MAG TPA: BatD family protein [Verrucomicrobiae bacterium]|nr:BatD family protein [Verrucomicrobiae bacterium]